MPTLRRISLGVPLQHFRMYGVVQIVRMDRDKVEPVQ
jgi:hypothetical protein